MNVIVCPGCGNKVDLDLWKCPCGGEKRKEKPVEKPKEEKKDFKAK